jgi:transposase-like protein
MKVELVNKPRKTTYRTIIYDYHHGKVIFNYNDIELLIREIKRMKKILRKKKLTDKDEIL